MQSERAYFGGAVINNFICVFGGQNMDYKVAYFFDLGPMRD